MWAVVGRICYCPLLNSKSPLICNVGNQQKNHKPRSLNYYLFANQRVSFFAIPFLPYKGFALTGHLKTAKCECLWSSAHCQVRMFMKQQNRRFQQLLAVENKTILQQLKPSTLYMMFQLTLIFYPYHTGMRSQMLYTNGVIWNLPRTNVCEAASKKRLKQLLAAEKNIYGQAKIVKSLHDMF